MSELALKDAKKISFAQAKYDSSSWAPIYMKYFLETDVFLK